MRRRQEEEVLAGAIKAMPVAGLRLNNERAVLTAIGMAPGSSGAEITRLTGLGAQTVSRMLLDLDASGLIVRGEPRRGGRGQPSIPIFLNPDGAFCIGCEVGWRHVEILVQNLGGQVLGRHRRDYQFPDRDAIFEEIGSLSTLMAGLVPEALRSRLLGIGLAMPSSFSRNLNLVGATETKAAEWRNVNVEQEVAKVTGLKTFLYNDGNAGCWGELAAMPVPRPRNVGYLLVSTFVGAGLVAEGKLWEGPNGRSANLGSMMVTGPGGKQEFVHLIASLHALERRLASAGKDVPTGNPLTWNWDGMGVVLDEWLDDAGRAIAKTVVNTSAVAELELAIVDGTMPKAIVQRLVESVSRHMEEMPALTFDWPEVRMGMLGGAAPALGASWLPMFRRYFSREPVDVDSLVG